MYKAPKEIYEEYYPDYKYDKDLYDKIKMFRISWAQKNDITIEFLASDLTGVYPVRFSQQDEDLLWALIEMDKDMLQKELYDLKGVTRSMRTVTNVTYVTLMWFAHKFATSRLPKDIIEDAIKECYFLLIYKIVCSLTAHYFKYNIDIEVAKAVNERMTNKFLIKRYGSWQALFDYKAQDLLPGNIHYSRLIRFSTDDMVRIISDLDTKIRDIFKNNYAVLLKVKQNNEKVRSTSLVQKDEEGQENIKDVTQRQDLLVVKIRSLIINKIDFINYDLVDLICARIKVISNNDLQTLLSGLTTIDTKILDKYLEGMISNSVAYLATKGVFSNYASRLYDCVNILISYWKAGNIKDKLAKEVKLMFTGLAEEFVDNKNRSIYFNLAVGAIVYIVTLSFL